MKHGQMKIAFFGHFNGTNIGNESTLQAMLHRLRQLVPDADFNCICTGPEATIATYNINAVPIRAAVVKPRTLRNSAARLARKLIVGVPSELYRWLKGFKTLWGTDALIVPGTGLLTDAYTFFYWGPCDMFRWSVTAKLCGCKLLFVSVGAGPIYSHIGRFCVKTALTLADFRSYRDASTVQYLKSIGFPADRDSILSRPGLQFARDGGARWLQAGHGQTGCSPGVDGIRGKIQRRKADERHLLGLFGDSYRTGQVAACTRI